MNIFTAPPTTPFNFLSLGAGVQSSCLALMAAHGEIGPVPDAAIFADTQAEPASVYKWLGWLTAQIQRCPHPFPVHVVTQGSLTYEVLKSKRCGIPAFTKCEEGIIGKLPARSCTVDFKVTPITRALRKFADIKRGQKTVTVTQWIGISWDELQRAKESHEPWSQNRWPLLELRMRRHQCLEWMEAKGYPHPPRSSCIYCPFHNNGEWRRLRDEEPEEWQRAILFERDLQLVKGGTGNMSAIPFLHRSGVPLSEVDLSTDEERGQGYFDFQSECEGFCGN
ncbi:hypothetical protein JIN84_12875 [Luteolibacter yonseiensis]|uniref:3'-phosphoadenosine 5'-phosphosulfate sulfotransferase (PAPS reductase)/FAD synthetase n=1 Tax=Luteolibacter yonseiensis TaxID=1144680 RepID=A0A934R523_9BACT|nr:hypothetical protein [Luteolibacter yonseiensis]MBK1816512.1 hypothetical protein [Luteolibacter yonseiensis]